MKQKTINGCATALLWSAILATLFCILMAVFTGQVGTNDTLNLLLSTAIQQGQKMTGEKVPQDKIEQVKPIAILGGIMIAISLVAIIMACCVRFTKACICVAIEIPILLIISVVLLVFGGLLVAPAAGGSQFVEDNCKLASDGKFDEMDSQIRKVFEPIAEFDKQFQKGVNAQMCTTLCKCYGAGTDSWVQEYKAIDDETYAKYDREFEVTQKDGEPLQDYFNRKAEKELIWFDVKDEKGQFSVTTMLQCLNNTEQLAIAMAKDLKDQPGGVARAAKVKKDFEEAKPDKEFVEIVSHIEDKFECSGLCSTPLFYFTQSVEKGVPKNSCIVPLYEDISLTLQNLGAMLIVTGLLFFIMIFISIPICCHNKEKEETEKDADEQFEKEKQQAEAEGREVKYKDTGSQKMQANEMA